MGTGGAGGAGGGTAGSGGLSSSSTAAMGGAGGTGGAGGGVQNCGADSQCDDGIACTIDRCLNAGPSLGTCAHEIQTENACGSNEVCDPSKGGCVDAPPCTIDSDCKGVFGSGPCIALVYCGPSQTCRFELPDVDNDDHMPMECGGDDCDDMQSAAYPGAAEICDGLDNNCNGLADGEDPQTDYSRPDGCGTCGLDCYEVLLHVDAPTVSCNPGDMPGKAPGTCTGQCTCLAPDDCWWDIDQTDGIGCEYKCQLTDPVDVCNDGLDNECDGKIDNGPGCP
ncbi:putative metal-binding motif-containing protein [Polyangium aurulentum]|uniref:putative metal-binding motif-containing protein n=1 Tax=Polyangium aurulentum TaxID=2567896 RepID=UPI0010ADB770|nr:putative metal-binding motif-containing protein [Polyangium aurulentum]UQA61785.1 putative metal-binding motif-containing protein [Polyangium aurulentum]